MSRGCQEFEAPRFRDNRKHEGGKVASPMHRPPLPPLPPREIFLVLISITGWVRPEGLCQ